MECYINIILLFIYYYNIFIIIWSISHVYILYILIDLFFSVILYYI